MTGPPIATATIANMERTVGLFGIATVAVVGFYFVQVALQAHSYPHQILERDTVMQFCFGGETIGHLGTR